MTKIKKTKGVKKVKKITQAKLKKLEKRKVKRLFEAWARNIKERDNNCCVICNEKKYLHAHHLLPRELKEFRFDIDNGLSLCAKHHKYCLTNSPHRNPYLFFKWFESHYPEQSLRLFRKYVDAIKEKEKENATS